MLKHGISEGLEALISITIHASSIKEHIVIQFYSTSAMTVHVTPSEQGGVVREPIYL